MAIRLEPKQIADYQTWEQAANNDLPGRYAMGFRGAPVFSLYDNDLPLSAEQIECGDHNGCAVLNFVGQPSRPALMIQGLNGSEIRRILASLDGQTRFREVRTNFSVRYSANQLRQLCQSLLGVVVFLPDAIQDLEQGIRRVEIVRFPVQSPYLVLREYWSNCRDVRDRVPELLDNLQTLLAFKSALADLHILATLGADLSTRYGGSGGVPTVPGGYRSHPVRTGLAVDKAHFIDGYLERLGLDRFRRDEYFVTSGAGTLLGAVAGEGLTFRHPPPDNGCLEKILEEMRIALAEVVLQMGNGGREAMLLPLSRFHKLFLHAHPFYNINNSVAMNITNTT
ncbi:MAG TPA: hypothetical protein ENI62_11720 [Gammaproteobacteria bacterium]|nr:hypothetical protein [Gammaproteobacteria bacterium]